MKILVTTDGSERSLDVLPHAGRLAASLGGSVTLLRILNPLIDAAEIVGKDLDAACQRVEDAWTAEMGAILRRHGIAGEPLVVRLEHGEDVATAILKAARLREASVVAMHSRGSGALRRALLGSVAMGVLGSTPVPLMLTGGSVEAPPASQGYNIVVTSDGSPASTAVLKALGPLIAGSPVRITLLRICELRSGRPGPADEVQAATEHLESLRVHLPAGTGSEVHCRSCKHDESVAEAIVAAARELGADAIALSTHGESAMHHLLAGSVALSVLGQSPLPVILSRSNAM